MRRLRSLLLLVVPLLLLLAGGIYLGGHPDGLPGFVRDPLVGDEDTRVVQEALDEVRTSYYRKVGEPALADAAVAGIVKSLDDRFSNYFTPAEYKRFQETQNSQFSGIGISVVEDPKGLRVVQVYDKSPADREGIRERDLIVAVGPTRLAGKDNETSTSLIKGPRGSDVELTIERAGKERKVTVTRATVSVPQVASQSKPFGGQTYGVVALAQFGSGAHAEVYAAIKEQLDAGAKGLVFDLRRNGGGLVSEAQLVASAFLREGDIVTTRGRNVPERTLKATGSPIAAKVPLVVLVDGSTASASEIVAGALQDRGRAKVIGVKTFGKGVFQEVIELSNGGALDITAGQYFLPSGRNLGGEGVSTGAGIRPDVPGEDDPKTQNSDEGMRAALKALAALPTGA